LYPFLLKKKISLFLEEKKTPLFTSDLKTFHKKKMYFCSICGKSGAITCSGCKIATYCGKECQKKDWSNHRANCTNAKILMRTEGDTRDATWCAASYLGRTVSSLDGEDRKTIEELYERKMVMYTGTMPFSKKKQIKCVLLCTNIDPPAYLPKTYDGASGEEEVQIFF
jgi:hypothetical protein